MQSRKQIGGGKHPMGAAKKKAMSTATRKSGKTRQKKNDGEDLHPIYSKYRKNFTAADLQKYSEEEEGQPLEQLIVELEAIHKRVARKKT
jgi:hypothetical protein